MNVFCCIKTCGRSRSGDHMKMFIFPRANSLIGRIWREKCNIPKEIYHKRPHICDRHFDKKDIVKKFLKRTAVPRYFLHEIRVGNANGNDQAINDESTYDSRSLEERPSASSQEKEPQKKVVETVIETKIVERCNNCDKKNELSLFYEKKCNTLNNENYQLQLQIKETSEMLEKTEHSSECLKTVEEVIHYKLKCEKLNEERLEYKKQAEDLLNESLRSLERSKYYEKKCDALKEKYERIISRLEDQLKEQSEIEENCGPECLHYPELKKQSRNINAMPEPTRSSNLEKPSEKASCTPEPTLSASSSDSPLNANLITEPMQLDNQSNSEPSQNVVSGTIQEEIVNTNELQFIYLENYVAPKTTLNKIITIEDDDNEVRCLLENENITETDKIEESDGEDDFNFNYDDTLMSPSSVKQEEEFILE